MTDNLLRRAQEGDLYAVLALSTKEELEPLVEVITSKTWNFLDAKDEYKRTVRITPGTMPSSEMSCGSMAATR